MTSAEIHRDSRLALLPARPFGDPWMTAAPAVFDDELPHDVRAQVSVTGTVLPNGCEPELREMASIAIARLRSIVDCERPPAEHEASGLVRIGSALARAGASADPVISLLGRLTSWAIDRVTGSEHVLRPGVTVTLREVMDTGNSMTRDLLRGFHGEILRGVAPSSPVATGEQLAVALLAGQNLAGSAPAYAVFALRTGPGDDIARLRPYFRNGEPRGMLSVLHGQGGYLLVPESNAGRILDLARKLHGAVQSPLWMAVGWARAGDVAVAGETAADVVSLAVASLSPPGVYRLQDFLIEYAVTQQPSIQAELRKLIAPVVGNSVLKQTLVAFLKADGNRTRAANSLIVHRSTLDYRLGRIEQLTGHQPTKPRGMQVLSMALTTIVAAAERDELPVISARQ